jgi:hypothetical protein
MAAPAIWPRELFKAQAGVSMVHIPYAGASPALVGLAGGQTDLDVDDSRRPRPRSAPAV